MEMENVRLKERIQELGTLEIIKTLLCAAWNGKRISLLINTS